MMQKQRDLRKARKFGQKEGYDKAKAEFNKEKENIIKELIKRGMNIEDIATIVGITTDEVKKIGDSV